MKQYVSNKPRPVGLKNFVITTSSGLMIDFIVYQGSSTDLSEKDFGLGPSLVLRLTETIPRGSTLYFDRYFTSLPLILQLKRKGYFATGTVMANRIGQVPLKEDKILKARGDSDEVTASGVAAVKWRDTKAITLLSTMQLRHPAPNHGPTVVEKRKRIRRRELSRDCERLQR